MARPTGCKLIYIVKAVAIIRKKGVFFEEIGVCAVPLVAYHFGGVRRKT